jgi:hypothetical protein
MPKTGTQIGGMEQTLFRVPHSRRIWIFKTFRFNGQFQSYGMKHIKDAVQFRVSFL